MPGFEQRPYKDHRCHCLNGRHPPYDRTVRAVCRPDFVGCTEPLDHLRSSRTEAVAGVYPAIPDRLGAATAIPAPGRDIHWPAEPV